MSGVLGGATGGFALAWACVMAVAAGVISLNVLARTQADAGALGAALIDELASLAALAAAFLVPGALAVWMRRRRPAWARLVPALAGGLVGFSILHVGGCELIRLAAYPLLLDRPRVLNVGDLPFELAKDVVAFGGALAGFLMILAWRTRMAPPERTEAMASFDIQDGGRLIRVALADILAVRAAGNYAEFLLADGRRPLMRGALEAMQAQLAPCGFVRTHRGWLVNRARMTGLRPQGSGDYAVELGGIEAPLSRRYAEALRVLRG